MGPGSSRPMRLYAGRANGYNGLRPHQFGGSSFWRSTLLHRQGRTSPPSLACALLLLATLLTACVPAAAPALTPTATASRPVPTATATPVTAASPAPVTVYPTAVPVATLTPQEVKALLDGQTKPLVFDARSKLSYDLGHVPGAVSLPLEELSNRLAEIPRDRLVIFYCTGST